MNAIDERHPWLGLDSFSEDTRGFFFGRDEEVAELARRVQRKLLTVLFGQSSQRYWCASLQMTRKP